MPGKQPDSARAVVGGEVVPPPGIRSKPSEVPILGIRMKISEMHPPRAQTLEESCAALEVLRRQEVPYRCKDYFCRRNQSISFTSSEDDPSSTQLGKSIEPACRQKMCDWCYRLCDSGQFPCRREMVAVAFSFLDRFADRCCGDRAFYKLAAVTSFYIATKIGSSAQLSIHSLVELGRGEFDCYDVQEMEQALLETLEWRMNPPTAQDFVWQMLALFPVSVTPIHVKNIYQRAIFFAELSVFDHKFVDDKRYFVAIACLLNAMEVVADEVEDREMEALRDVGACMAIDQDHPALEMARKRLWYLYSHSAQNVDSCIFPHASADKRIRSIHPQRANSSLSHSPISVRTHGLWSTTTS